MDEQIGFLEGTPGWVLSSLFLGDCIRVRFRAGSPLCIETGWMGAQQALQDMTGHVATCIVPFFALTSRISPPSIFCPSCAPLPCILSRWTGVERANEGGDGV